MEPIKDYCVVTITLLPDDTWYVHTYGPYSIKEASRMSHQLESKVVKTFIRKLLDKNEITAKPRTPRG